MKHFIKQIIRSLGWELRRYDPACNPSNQLFSALKYSKINVVFDIGANTGQFATELRSVGFKHKIISFEPLSSAYPIILEKTSKDKKWYLHPQSAIGDKDSTIDINISGNSVSSSILPMLDTHSSAAEDSAYIGIEKVCLTRLDSISDQYLDKNSNLFIKIDTQGYEWQVLDGASKTIKKARGILIELSLLPLYDGQKLWQEIIKRLEDEGFVLWTLQQGFTDSRTGRSLQLDAIFLRKNNDLHL